MDAKTERALEGSIKKWRAIVRGIGTDEGTENCPLCKLFYKEKCVGCPVMEMTGLARCCGTPYEEWEDFNVCVATEDEHFEKAQEELNFLISLRQAA